MHTYIYRYVYIGTLPKYFYIYNFTLIPNTEFLYFFFGLENPYLAGGRNTCSAYFVICHFRVFLRLLLFRNIRQSLCREFCSKGTFFCISALPPKVVLLYSCLLLLSKPKYSCSKLFPRRGSSNAIPHEHVAEKLLPSKLCAVMLVKIESHILDSVIS